MKDKIHTNEYTDSERVGVDDRRLVRLCVNCAHHIENVCRENVCMRKNRSKGVDPVTGREIKTGGIYCDRRSNMIVARLLGECGKEGRFFKPNTKEHLPR